MKKWICLLSAAIFIWTAALPAAAAAKQRLLFVPHDDRPISFQQTVDTARASGFEALIPPASLLGDRNGPGDVEALWRWVFANAHRADAMVLSGDALLYGNLVASRKHALDGAVLARRAANFKKLRAANPATGIYVFSSVMRTPRAGGGEEPAYYKQYGPAIFRRTALLDKQETDGLTKKESRELAALTAAIPADVYEDWMQRRAKNLTASRALVEDAKNGVFTYLILGRDDNAPYSQTRRDARRLLQAAELDASRIQSMPGIDEMGLVLLTRAVNDLTNQIPFVAVKYAPGVGARTVPTYSDEPIGRSVREHLFAAGAIPIPSAERADLILMVNTPADGVTPEAGSPANHRPNSGRSERQFAAAAQRYLDQGRAVAVADVAFGNGADNSLMAELERRGLLPRLAAYSGWNTATNSTGFAIGQGILAGRTPALERERLLATRYLDDWAYQANIRWRLKRDELDPRGGDYMQLGRLEPLLTQKADQAVRRFTERHLSDFPIAGVKVYFPWHRMFELGIDVTMKR